LAVAGCASGEPAGISTDVLVRAVATGTSHSCALHGNGTVSCWGLASSINGGGNEILAPAKIPGLIVHALAAGPQGNCGITPDGHVRCWGRESFTVLKENGMPLDGVMALAMGLTFGCATNAQGTYCWGKNDLGQLARPLTLTDSPAALLAQPGFTRLLGAGQTVLTHDGKDRLCAWGHNGTHEITGDDVTLVYTTPQCGTVPRVFQLHVGADHACVLHPDGSFACWGERYYGQLGIGGGVDDTADIPPYGSDTRLSDGVVQLAAGASHTCAMLADGAVTCFGLNSKGQVGPGANTTAEEVRTPAPVTGFAARVESIWSGPNAQHTCAVVAGGKVQCWGSDSDGQLGDGVTTHDDTRFSHGPVTVKL